MIRLVSFILSIGILVSVAGAEQVENIDLNINLIFPGEKSKEDRQVCTSDEVQAFSQAYHNCFIDKKYEDGGKDLENLVARILEHSKVCIENSTRKCRLNRKGFVAIMDQVIYQVKDYCHIYLEHINKDKDKIKDFQCMDGALTISTYQSCFRDAFVAVADLKAEKFQQRVENAISCTNKSHKLCSRSAKTSINRLVRQILRVEQPEKEDIEEEVMKPEPPKKWYDSIIQPFISMWRAVRSFFGF